MATFKKCYEVIIDKIEEGDSTMMETALNFLYGFNFAECETREETIGHYQYVESFNGVSMYYDFGADYYFFTDDSE